MQVHASYLWVGCGRRAEILIIAGGAALRALCRLLGTHALLAARLACLAGGRSRLGAFRACCPCMSSHATPLKTPLTERCQLLSICSRNFKDSWEAAYLAPLSQACHVQNDTLTLGRACAATQTVSH